MFSVRCALGGQGSYGFYILQISHTPTSQLSLCTELISCNEEAEGIVFRARFHCSFRLGRPSYKKVLNERVKCSEIPQPNSRG
jgi:hypothetical protein